MSRTAVGHLRGESVSRVRSGSCDVAGSKFSRGAFAPWPANTFRGQSWIGSPTSMICIGGRW